MKIILASGSPRRKELLGRLTDNFEIMVSDKEENITADSPEDTVKKLSAMKAKDIDDMLLTSNILIIGADTIVYHNGEILGKPCDEDDAFNKLKGLSGDVHSVYTGVSVIFNHDIHSFYEKTDVYVKEMTDYEIIEYIKTGEPMDKAGAYGIQGIFSKYIDHINGDYENVVGLPVDRLNDEVKQRFDIDLKKIEEN